MPSENPQGKSRWISLGNFPGGHHRFAEWAFAELVFAELVLAEFVFAE